jgi:hypothetical protein
LDVIKGVGEAVFDNQSGLLFEDERAVAANGDTTFDVEKSSKV